MPTAELLINARTMRIGHEVYPLATISRVKTVRVVPGGRAATWYPLPWIVVLAIVGGAGYWAGQNARRFGLPAELGALAPRVATVLVTAAAVAVACLTVLLIYRLLVRRNRYALIIETAGTQYAALTGTDRREIARVAELIVDAIESPPPHEVRHPINLNLRGAQGVQVGGSNVQYNR